MTATPAPAGLDELDELLTAATPGEWYERPGHLGPAVFSDAPAHPGVGFTYMPADAALIVALRNATPDLLARLRRAEAANRAAIAEAWDEGCAAGMEWTPSGPNGVPHDPPSNPYDAADLRAAVTDTTGDPAEFPCGWCNGTSEHRTDCPSWTPA